MDVYQSLVAVNPVTLIAQICNLFIVLFFFKKLFLNKVKDILDQRRQAADQEITDAQAAKAEALEIKETYEKNMQEAKAQANEILDRAQKTATVRGEEIIRQATEEAAHIKQKAASDIALEKKKAINDDHGVAPWTQKIDYAGVIEEDVMHNLYVDWNDFEGLQQVFDTYKV